MTTQELEQARTTLNSAGDLVKVVNVEKTKKRMSYVVLSAKRWSQVMTYKKTVRVSLLHKSQSHHVCPRSDGDVKVEWVIRPRVKWVIIPKLL